MTQTISNLNAFLEDQYLVNYPVESMRFFEQAAPKDIAQLLSTQKTKSCANIFERMPNLIAAKILEYCQIDFAGRLLSELNSAKAAEILVCVNTQIKEAILASLDKKVAQQITEVIAYPSDNAGSLMDKRFIPFHADMTVGEATDKLRRFAHIKYRVLFLVDDEDVLQQYIHLQDLLFSTPETKLKSIAKNLRAFVRDTDNITDVSDAINSAKIADLPVVDYAGKLLGVIRYKMLVQTLQETAVSELQTLVGVNKEERALSTAFQSVKMRLPWLQINLITAFIAASIVGMFEGLISQYTALAILLPVVAGQSGNTGAQALAVTMRGLVLREVTVSQWFKVISKEAKTGFINGVAIAVTTAIGVYLWSNSLGLCLIIFLSMIASMIIAGVAGAAIPIILSRMGMDPASSASIILTTITDVCGFFSFLGIATLLIFML